jgi:hypothetical protein
MRLLNLFLLFSVLVSFARCSGQTKSAVEDQKKAYKALAKAAPRGETPGAFIFLKATINGKPWTATSVFRDPDAGSSYYLISGESNGYSDQRVFPVSLGEEEIIIRQLKDAHHTPFPTSQSCFARRVQLEGIGLGWVSSDEMVELNIFKFFRLQHLLGISE